MELMKIYLIYKLIKHEKIDNDLLIYLSNAKLNDKVNKCIEGGSIENDKESIYNI